MFARLKKIIFQNHRTAMVLIPLYLALIKYPINLIRSRAIDPVQYFIFKKHGLVYLINSKVAQTAITNTCGNKDKREYSGIAEKHLGEKVFQIPNYAKNYHTFTFVRNPFDRLVSCYRSKYVADKERYKKEFLDFDFYLLGHLRKKPTFPEFVKKISTIPDWLADRHFKSQYSLIFRESSVPIAYIGRYETINKDFEVLREKFPLESLPHLNPSGKSNWRDYYTPELVDMVARRYHNDLDAWYPEAKKELLNYVTNQHAR